MNIIIIGINELNNKYGSGILHWPTCGLIMCILWKHHYTYISTSLVMSRNNDAS